HLGELDKLKVLILLPAPTADSSTNFWQLSLFCPALTSCPAPAVLAKRSEEKRFPCVAPSLGSCCSSVCLPRRSCWAARAAGRSSRKVTLYRSAHGLALPTWRRIQSHSPTCEFLELYPPMLLVRTPCSFKPPQLRRSPLP